MIPLPQDLVSKIEWAERRLRELDDAVRAYVATQPVQLEARPSGQFHEGLERWNVWVSVTEPPPVELALLAGDVVQNTRGVLDYLAQALVLTAGGTPVHGPGGTQFPIKTDRPTKPLKIAGGTNPGILREVEALQPYSSGDPHSHPLTKLNSLNNTNKHQAISVLGSAGAVPAAVAIYGEDPESMVIVGPYARWFPDGDRLDPVAGLFPPGVTPRTAGRFDVVVSLEFDAWLTVSMIDELDYYLRHVRDFVVPRFRPHFAEPWPEDVFTTQQVVDPSASLPDFYPQALVDITEQVVSETGRSKDDPHLMVMGLTPGISLAMGYHAGGTPLAGPSAPKFRPTGA
jgi:hypothetical protein